MKPFKRFKSSHSKRKAIKPSPWCRRAVHPWSTKPSEFNSIRNKTFTRRRSTSVSSAAAASTTAKLCSCIYDCTPVIRAWWLICVHSRQLFPGTSSPAKATRTSRSTVGNVSSSDGSNTAQDSNEKNFQIWFQIVSTMAPRWWPTAAADHQFQFKSSRQPTASRSSSKFKACRRPCCSSNINLSRTCRWRSKRPSSIQRWPVRSKTRRWDPFRLFSRARARRSRNNLKLSCTIISHTSPNRKRISVNTATKASRRSTACSCTTSAIRTENVPLGEWTADDETFALCFKHFSSPFQVARLRWV